jgi:outer membrane protein assembly factor BamE (lipoprotein component of BamABCDE complex)
MGMTRRRQLAIGLAGIVAAGVAVFSLRLYSSRTAITEDNAVRIRPGMTLAEVEAVLGGPARDESTGPLVAVLPWRDGEDDRSHEIFERLAPQLFRAAPLASSRELQEGRLLLLPPVNVKVWVSNRQQIRVGFDDAGRVQAFDWLAVRRVYENPLDRLRRWLGL